MKKLLVTAVASLGFIAAAFAGTAEGVVQSVDPATRTITLEDGQAFVAADAVDLGSIEPGASVMVSYDDGTNTATDVKVN